MGHEVEHFKLAQDHYLLIRRVAEDCHTFGGLSEQPKSALHFLTARTVQIPDHLKLSQRREKLMRLATEVTALESHLRHVHPVCYGAAGLFSDGTVAFPVERWRLNTVAPWVRWDNLRMLLIEKQFTSKTTVNHAVPSCWCNAISLA